MIAERADRLMRAPRTLPWAPLVVGLATLAIVAVNWQGRSPHRLSVVPQNGVILALVLSLFTWWSVRSWRRLWRIPGTRLEKVVYGYGGKAFGILFWAGTTASQAFRGLSAEDSPIAFVFTLVSLAIIGLPVCLWVGYWWGRGMSFFYAIDPDTP